MKETIRFAGQNTPFEGDRTVRLRSIPDGAHITAARVRLTPRQCVEMITFDAGGAGTWGATRQEAQNGVSVVVDFHKRRMVTQLMIVPQDTNGTASEANLLIDMGGIWMALAEDGTIVGTGDSPAFCVNLQDPTHPLPPVIVQRIRLGHDGNSSPVINLQSVTIQSLPGNVTLRLGETPPFWARPGEMAVAESSPDFAAILQAFLAEAEVRDGYYDLPLVIHSDTIACLDVELEIEYIRQQSILADRGGETTFAFTHDGLPEASADLLQLEVPVGSRIVAEETTAQVTGSFQPSRIVHGPTGAVAEPASVPINAALSQAQPVRLSKTLSASAVDLRLRLHPKHATATVSLNLLDDSDGKPANDPLLPAPVMITFDRDRAGTAAWISAELPVEFQFEKGVTYWLTLQVVSGELFWLAADAEAGATGLHFTDNDGLSWRQTQAAELAGPAAALYRLRHIPDRFQMPIELQVSAGDSIERVPLDRFETMGRVEFDLGIEEVAQAVNNVVEAESAAVCPEGEHALNGAFEEWATSGSGAGATRPIELPRPAALTALAIAPHGREAYMAEYVEIGNGDDIHRFWFMGLPCNEFTVAGDEGITLPGRAWKIVVHPNGRRAYVATEYEEEGTEVNGGSDADDIMHVIVVVDLVARQRLGVPVALPAEEGPLDLALTPDGSRLYVIAGSDSMVRAIDTALVEQHVLQGSEPVSFANVSVAAQGRLPDINLGDGVMPAALALSPYGNHLYVAGVESLQGGTFHVFEIGTHARAAPPVDLGNDPRAMAVTPAGDRVLVVNAGDHTVSLVNTNRPNGAPGTIPLPGSQPTGDGGAPALVVGPDGQRAFVHVPGSELIGLINLSSRRATEWLDFGEGVFETKLALTPRGNRLYVLEMVNDIYGLYGGGSDLRYVPVGVEQPVEWTLTSGAVLPVCQPAPFNQVAWLGLSPGTGDVVQQTSALSQVMPATGACTYDFTFWGLANGSDAVAELIWLGDGCELQRIDEIPIATGNVGPAEEGSDVVLFAAAPSVPAPLPESDPLLRHQRRLVAPPGANQVEIRFTAPPATVAAIDGVSLLATREQIANSSLRIDDSGQLPEWEQIASAGAGLIVTDADAGVTLRNPAPATARLLQTVAVAGGQPYDLAFHGRLLDQGSGSEAARVEVKWLTVDGAEAATPTTMEIPMGGEERRVIRGTTPEGAAEAEVTLVIPGGVALMVEQISLRPVEVVTVQLTFIAQAPGEMTVANFHAGFEEVAMPAPAAPETGLCAPTRPGLVPGEANGDCYCPCCGGDRPLVDPQPTTTPAGRPATGGTCGDCGAELTLPGGPPAQARVERRQVSGGRAASVESRRLARLSFLASPGVIPEPPAVIELQDELPSVLPRPQMAPHDWAEWAGIEAERQLPPLTDVKGIGPKRAARLVGIGVTDMELLADAVREDIAAATAVGPQAAEAMISAAKEKVVEAEYTVAPLVSCIMATYNRPQFVGQAIHYFLQQDYPHRELIIVDDGTEPIGHLAPDDARVRVIRREERLHIGAKHNLAIAAARGSIICVWDDDSYYAEQRLSYQMGALLKEEADICGLNNVLHYDVRTNRAWHSVRPRGRQRFGGRTLPWMPGSTLCFTRAYWQNNPFPDVAQGEDILFIRSDPAARILRLRATTYHVDVIHGANSSVKDTTSPRWRPYPVEEIQRLMGEDWDFYAEMHRTLSAE